MAKKSGKKASWATNPHTGEIVEGLYTNKWKDGRVKAYYYLDNKKQVTCGSDFNKALQKFEIYKREHNIIIQAPKIHEFEIDIPEDGSLYSPEDYVKTLRQIEQGQVSIDSLNITDEFWSLAEKVIKANLPYSAKRLNIPELAYLHDVKPLEKSLPMSEVWDLYKSHYTGSSDKDLNRNIKPAWKEFKSIVGRSSIREITFEDITTYNLKIHKRAKKATIKNKYRYVKNNFDPVKRVIRRLRDKSKGVIKQDCITLLEHMNQLTYVKKEEENKAKFNKSKKVLVSSELKNLLDCSNEDILVKCSILLGLNCCIRWGDFAEITKDMIDFDNKEYLSFRNKNGNLQACKLWDITIKAIKEYMDKYPNDTEYIFLTKHNNIWSDKDLRNHFNKVRTKAEMEWLTQDKLRKMTATKASQLGYHSNTLAYKAIMGRKIPGADESYIYQMPEDTKDLVRDLHEYYFTLKK